MNTRTMGADLAAGLSGVKRPLFSLLVLGVMGAPLMAWQVFRVEVVDAESGWPVPLVELTTTYQLRFVSDNAGVIAIDAPELMGREAFFHVHGHGYGVAKDGFGYAGVRMTPAPGETRRIEVQRSNIAKRLGRWTGTGLFAEAQQCGDLSEWKDSPLVGQDSVLMCRHDGGLFWIWGDTTVYRYPLGVYQAVAATTSLKPVPSFEPPLKPSLDYFLDDEGHPRGVAIIPGKGPTWISGMISLRDRDGGEHLVATYSKISGFLHAYERGLCEWNEKTHSFEGSKVLWREGDPEYSVSRWHDGHPFTFTADDGEERVGVGNPLPTISFPATFEAWQDPATWRSHLPQPSFRDPDGGEILAHTGAVAFNPYRNKWITIFNQRDGSPSRLGEVWYAESDDPFETWNTAVKVLTHDRYTFYNPRIHFELTAADDPFIVFAGTYTAQFADRPDPTPRYDYNQMWYRLDLDDARLHPEPSPDDR